MRNNFFLFVNRYLHHILLVCSPISFVFIAKPTEANASSSPEVDTSETQNRAYSNVLVLCSDKANVHVLQQKDCVRTIAKLAITCMTVFN